MKWLPRSPSRGRVRDAKILCALTLKRERARNLERRSPKKWASPRGKGGRYIDFFAFTNFPRAHRARRKLRCLSNDSASRLFAALRVPSSKSTQSNMVSIFALFHARGNFWKKTWDAGNRRASAMSNEKEEKKRRVTLRASETLATCAFLPFCARRPIRE